jgi:hypothetical protein
MNHRWRGKMSFLCMVEGAGGEGRFLVRANRKLGDRHYAPFDRAQGGFGSRDLNSTSASTTPSSINSTSGWPNWDVGGKRSHSLRCCQLSSKHSMKLETFDSVWAASHLRRRVMNWEQGHFLHARLSHSISLSSADSEVVLRRCNTYVRSTFVLSQKPDRFPFPSPFSIFLAPSRPKNISVAPMLKWHSRTAGHVCRLQVGDPVSTIPPPSK